MHDVKAIRQDPEFFVKGLARKGATGVEEILDLDAKRREILAEVESLRARRNAASAEIARMKRVGEDAEQAVAEMRGVGERIKELEDYLEGVEPQMTALVAQLPNIPDPSVPDGGEEANKEIKRVGRPRDFAFEPKPHWEVGTALGIIDFERAGKVAGPRFAFLRGDGARLERALIAFMLDLHTRQHGYEELIPPYLVNRQSAFGTGNLPKFEEDMFQTTDGYFLIPTAEVPVTNFHRDEILPLGELPRKYCAYTACFRSEAGAAGKDTRGLIRNHQFDKVELVKITRPDTSYDELEKLTRDAEEVLEALEIPYRRQLLSTGEMTFASAKTYDLEAYFPGTGTYREISSCTNFEAFQARRAGIRFRDADGKVRFAHTLNGSGLAVGRTWACVVENYQEKDGTITVPEVLRRYLSDMPRIGAGPGAVL